MHTKSCYFAAYGDPAVGSFGFSGYFVDLQEKEGVVPGRWEWGDGTPLTYDEWKQGEPNYVFEPNAIIEVPDIKFLDVQPIVLFSVICEKHP